MHYEEIGEKLKHALIMGDLSSLTNQEKVQYYNKTCESLGLNPLTKPFAYIKLQGKETLYATKNATDQLRKVYSVSIIDCEQKQIGDLLIVTVKAQDKDGKTDIDVGALPTSGLKGDNLANAIMKAVTKAKRRVTLSICGLGMLDETEIETIPKGQVQLSESPREEAPKLDTKYYDISDFPSDLRDIYTDGPLLKDDMANGPEHLCNMGKFRGSRLREIDTEELSLYFSGYLKSAVDKQKNGSFRHPLWQRDFEAIKDYLENFEMYQEILEEPPH